MPIDRRSVVTLVCMGAAGPSFGQAEWPAKAFRMIVPFAPGGATDVLARLVAARLQASLGQPVTAE